MSSSRCQIDRDILNENSIENMTDIALSFFASACGKNRGAFVLDPPDGKTYGCLVFPENMSKLAGIADSTTVIKDANAIKDNYMDGNITSSETVSLLDYFVERVYESTPLKESDIYACDVNGLAKLSCDGSSRSPRLDGAPIRSVTLEWETTYTIQDFAEMKAVGLNTVQIPIPTFLLTNTVDQGILEEVLDDVKTAGLQAILSLVATGDELDAVVSAADFCNSNAVVMALTLPKGMTIPMNKIIDSVRLKVGLDLTLFVPMEVSDLGSSESEFGDDPNVYGSLDWSHTSTVADIASSNSQQDRSKLFYHESVACTMRSPMEHSKCNGLPLFWSSGFNLAIDDCANGNTPDYGQCDRFEETIESKWWRAHRQSFAARQMFAAEQGLGWSFSAWKPKNSTSLDLLALYDVSKAGLFPNFSNKACLNPPKNDFALGDDTLSPTASPPPNCGNGWWNYTSFQCDYWVPPPEPTMSPTIPCPECQECPTAAPTIHMTQHSTTALAMSAFGGAAAVLILGFLHKLLSKRNQYSSIPSATINV